MYGYLSADIICSEKRTVSYEDQIMFKDKYPSIFSPQMEAIVFIILQIFFATRAIFKIRPEYSRIFPSFCWGIFGHVTCLGQSRESKKIWWITISYMFRWYSDIFFGTKWKKLTWLVVDSRLAHDSKLTLGSWLARVTPQAGAFCTN